MYASVIESLKEWSAGDGLEDRAILVEKKKAQLIAALLVRVSTNFPVEGRS